MVSPQSRSRIHLLHSHSPLFEITEVQSSRPQWQSARGSRYTKRCRNFWQPWCIYYMMFWYQTIFVYIYIYFSYFNFFIKPTTDKLYIYIYCFLSIKTKKAQQKQPTHRNFTSNHTFAQLVGPNQWPATCPSECGSGSTRSPRSGAESRIDLCPRILGFVGGTGGWWTLREGRLEIVEEKWYGWAWLNMKNLGGNWVILSI